MYGTVRIFHVDVHAEATDRYAIARLTKQTVIRLRFIGALFQTTIVVGAYTALLALGKFVFTHSSSHVSGMFRP